jgi:hypothetical protein
MATLVPRTGWGMPGPLGVPMRLPAHRLYLHHSVTAASNGHEAVRTVANIGIQRFGRASYSYACTPDGVLYEMQGNRIGAHTAGQNSTSMAVVLVGNYDQIRPSIAQVRAVAWLHHYLTARGWLVIGAPLLGHRDAPGASTACPGRHAYAVLGDMRRLIDDPPQEDDMPYSPDQLTKIVRDAVQAELTNLGDKSRTALLELSRRASLVSQRFLAIPDDFRQGGTVYYTDLATKVGFPQGSALHMQIKADLKAQALSTDARRLPAAVLDAIPDE